ncbi:MAG: hypothetical protein HKN99_00385 [Winogradskyella sp.]|nr:hypothetical protein [Winogradskyella sp.]
MKTYLTKAMASVVLATTLFSCSVEPIDSDLNPTNLMTTTEMTACSNADPLVKLVNNGSIDFDIHIYSMVDGSLLNSFVGVTPGSNSGWLDFANGEVLVSLENSSASEFKVVHQMDLCTQLQLEIAADNTLLPAAPQQL